MTGSAAGRLAPPVLVALVLAVFANATGGVFVFDDIADILQNDSAKAATFVERLAAMNRPLTKASYALQDLIHGPWAAGFHAVNVILHAAAALLAYALVRRAFRLTGGADGAAALAALAAAALWAVHPALTETVTYVSGRSMGLSSVLVLAMLLAATGRQTQGARLAAFAAAFLAPLARETALIAPAILVWWTLTLKPSGARSGLAPALLGTALAAALIAMLPRHTDLIAHSLASRPPAEALRGNVHAAFDILTFWAAPWRVTIDPAPPLAWPWSDARTLAKLAFFAAAAVAAIALRRRAPLFAFAIGLALLALAPSNTLLWRADPVSLKPLYLGGLGLVLALAAVLPRRAFVALALAGTVALGIATIQRNALFADEIALWQDAAAKTPDYGRPSIMLGYALFNAGRYGDAEAALARGCDLDPLDAEAQAALDLVRAILAAEGRKP